jgi:predicted dithiol-disulfide oxidoreductase (DUF899 family)
MTTHDVRFPDESDEYRAARNRLLQAEVELRAHIEAVALQRQELPLGGAVPTDYAFEEWHGGSLRKTRLSELFAPGTDTLLLYSFMWVPRSQRLGFVGPCPSCTSIMDGIDGMVPHLTQRISFAVAAKAPIESFRSHGEARGWRHARPLSAVPSRYNSDYGAEDAEGNQGRWPPSSHAVRAAFTISGAASSSLSSASRRTGRVTSISCGRSGRYWIAPRMVVAANGSQAWSTGRAPSPADHSPRTPLEPVEGAGSPEGPTRRAGSLASAVARPAWRVRSMVRRAAPGPVR